MLVGIASCSLIVNLALHNVILVCRLLTAVASHHLVLGDFVRNLSKIIYMARELSYKFRRYPEPLSSSRLALYSIKVYD